MKLTPDELRDAYGRATSEGSGEHPPADLLARLLGGDVTEDERRDAVAHVAACSRCAEEVRVARPIADGMSPVREGGRVLRPAVWRRPAVLLAAAATVLVAGGLALRSTRNVPSGSAYRAPEGAGLRSLLPEGARLSRGAPLLRWAGGSPGVAFDVLLANEKLDILARVPGLRERQLEVPASVLGAIPSGGKLVWKVTVVQPDGSRTETASFVSVVE